LVNSKRQHGQYYTTTNPFKGEAFEQWNTLRPKDDSILEPFAGAGYLFDYVDGDWVGYDIEPNHESVIQRDTIKDFPTNFSTAITNPPYFAKNSARRLKMDYPYKYEDMYLDCLELILKHCDYVAAIIPSTFHGTNLFQHRLLAWDKLDYTLFEDTTVPVGVAYFVPHNTKTTLYVNGQAIDEYQFRTEEIPIEYNVEHGNYVLSGIDNTTQENIQISDDVDSFDREKYLKHTSRNYVLFYSPIPLDIEKTNENIRQWREKTQDFYLTSFKSMMKTGKYRKRISFKHLNKLVIPCKD